MIKEIKIFNVGEDLQEVLEDVESLIDRLLADPAGQKLYVTWVATNDNGDDIVVGAGDVLKVWVLHTFDSDVSLRPELYKQLKEHMKELGFLE